MINKIKYVICHVENNENISYCRDLLAIMEKSYTQYARKEYQIVQDRSEHPKCESVPDVSSTRVQFRVNVPNIYITDDRKYIYTSLGKVLKDSIVNSSFDIKYTIHQHIMNDCYQFFGLDCAKYQLIYGSTPNHIYTAWHFDDDYIIRYIRILSIIISRYSIPFTKFRKCSC